MLAVTFFEDESLLSFISRTARANGRSRLHDFFADFRIDPYLVHGGDEAETKKVAECLNVAPDYLLRRRIIYHPDKSCSLGDARFDRGVLSRNKLRCCPWCLSEDEADPKRMPGTRRYHRTIWMITNVLACTRHDLALVSPATERKRWYIPDPAHELELAAAEYANPATWARRAATAFEVFVDERLRNRKNHGSILDSVSLAVAVDLCKLFGMAATSGWKFGLKTASDEKLNDASAIGFLALSQGPSGVHEILAQANGKRKAIANRGANALYGDLYRYLHYKGRGSEYDAVREIVRKFTVDHFSLISSARVFAQTVEDAPMSAAAIAQEVGLSKPSLRNLLAKWGYRDAVQTKLQLIPRDTALEIIDKLRHTSELRNMPKLLGWEMLELRRLVRAGILLSVVPKMEKNVGIRPRFSNHKALELKENLVARGGNQLDGLKTLGHALARSKLHNPVLRAVFSGALPSLQYVERGSLYESCFVNLDELRPLLR